MVLRGLYSIHTNEAQDFGKWWIDLETTPTAAEWEAMKLSTSDVAHKIDAEANLGRRRALDCLLGKKDCTPEVTPAFKGVRLDYAAGDSTRRLKTRRGLKGLAELNLLRPDAAAVAKERFPDLAP